jgi:archaeosine-15-forming tRNA-guanine transglycosylase
MGTTSSLIHEGKISRPESRVVITRGSKEEGEKGGRIYSAFCTHVWKSDTKPY